MKTKNKYLLIIDLAIIILSILFAFFLTKTQILINILTSTKGLEIVGSFIAGIFFTSVFTTAPAAVTLAEIAQVSPIWLTALCGAMGATLGDLLIFRFVKDRLSKHLFRLIKKKEVIERVKHILHQKYFRWLTLFIAGFIIASPLPDELGVTLLGFSRLRPSFFIPFSFFSNFIGILLIGVVARAII